MDSGSLSSEEHEQVTRLNRRDYIVAYASASAAYLLILIPQYNTVERILSMNARIPESFLSSLVQLYGPTLGVQLSILSTVSAFQVISGVLLLLTSRMGRAPVAWRLKYMIASVSFIGYVGYSLGIGFFPSLG